MKSGGHDKSPRDLDAGPPNLDLLEYSVHTTAIREKRKGKEKKNIKFPR
jgi:hypothetical protein